ncbi:hypothetical protein OIU74_016837 [Salix koriyanagi]|uniref:Uncharacterized protein n=1 Tax=Salix koriyanagi TaxID=2511006 RepID=A0A9Q0SSL4_9ROSI|nr:hypothetical protein OIU74_016837 [Salix koriyanagi]
MAWGSRTVTVAEPNKITITTQEGIGTWAWTWKLPIFH